MLNINRGYIKKLVAEWQAAELSAKTIKNLVSLLRLIWHDAQDDGDVSVDNNRGC